MTSCADIFRCTYPSSKLCDVPCVDIAAVSASLRNIAVSTHNRLSITESSSSCNLRKCSRHQKIWCSWFLPVLAILTDPLWFWTVNVLAPAYHDPSSRNFTSVIVLSQVSVAPPHRINHLLDMSSRLALRPSGLGQVLIGVLYRITLVLVVVLDVGTSACESQNWIFGTSTAPTADQCVACLFSNDLPEPCQ